MSVNAPQTGQSLWPVKLWRNLIWNIPPHHGSLSEKDTQLMVQRRAAHSAYKDYRRTTAVRPTYHLRDLQWPLTAASRKKDFKTVRRIY